MKLTTSSFIGITISSIISGIAGFCIGGPIGALIGFGATFTLGILTTALAPEPRTPKPPKPFKLEDFQLPSVSHYQVIQRIYGETICAGIYANVWNFKHEEVKESVDTGKFGGDNTQEVTVGYDYYASVYYIVAEGLSYFSAKPQYSTENNIVSSNIYYIDYFSDKLNIYSQLPDRENKIFPWLALSNIAILDLYLGRDVKSFPQVYFRIKDVIFKDTEIEKLSYLQVNTQKWGTCLGVNPLAVLISLLTEEFFDYHGKKAINSFLNSPYIEKDKFLNLLVYGLSSNLPICHAYNQPEKISEVIKKLCKIYDIRLTTIPKDNKPFVLTAYSISERSKLIEFTKTTPNNNSETGFDIQNYQTKQFNYDFICQIDNCDEINDTTIEDIIEFTFYKENINKYTIVDITLKHELNKQTLVHFSFFHNNSQIKEIKQIDLSEFHYTEKSYSFLLEYAYKLVKNNNIFNITTNITQLKKIDLGSPVRFFNPYLGTIHTGRVTQIRIGNHPNYKVSLTIVGE